MNRGRFGLPTLAPPAVDYLGEFTTVQGQADIVVHGIPGGYRDLQLTCRLRGAAAATSQIAYMQLNGDTGSVYDFVRSNRFGANGGQGSTFVEIADGVADSGTSGARAIFTVLFSDYASSEWNKAFYAHGGSKYANTSSEALSFQVSGLYRSLNPIHQVRIYPSSGNWAPGSSISVYGVR